eukprot:1984181-Pyramimonas_sp.AAC.1
MVSPCEEKPISWWTPSSHLLTCVNAGMSESRSRALVALGETPALEIYDIARAYTCVKATASVGADTRSPRAMLDAPVGALEIVA